MSTYRPRRYWSDRYMTQGPAYVGPYGDPERCADQAKEFTAAINKYLPTSDKVLDFGCGVGRFTEAVQTYCDEYHGVDINRLAIEHASKELPLHWARFHYLDEEDKLPFENDTFGCLMSITVIQHISEEEWKWWAVELKRVLRPLAQVFIIDHATPANAFHMFVRRPEDVASRLNMTITHKELIRGGSHWVYVGVVEK